MVEFRPAGLGVWFWVGFGVFVPFSTICLFFPSFNDDLGTMPTRRPYSWKKKDATLCGTWQPVARRSATKLLQHFLLRCSLARNCRAPLLIEYNLCPTVHIPWQRQSWVQPPCPRPPWLHQCQLLVVQQASLAQGEQAQATVQLTWQHQRQSLLLQASQQWGVWQLSGVSTRGLRCAASAAQEVSGIRGYRS